ncbi:hypothetical protein TELCIR_15380 [Teladorsagia circumcincta]|uniref:Uncharacterized protein n=1 Tax=Teladorsagia circumcincta TaxID=45464 RepID=A0A2G9U0J9_TELCI|nr:hypothetical protein TELCIR_15380 [Teladorsagia circumcincta]
MVKRDSADAVHESSDCAVNNRLITTTFLHCAIIRYYQKEECSIPDVLSNSVIAGIRLQATEYHNPTTVPITATVVVAPKMRHTQDMMQSEKVVFAPTSATSVKEVTVTGKPFVLNPGKWTLGVDTKQRPFLVPIEHLPEIIDAASHVQTGDDKKVIEAIIEVPEDYDYAVVV